MDFGFSSSSWELTENKDSQFILIINIIYSFPSYTHVCVCIISVLQMLSCSMTY